MNVENKNHLHYRVYHTVVYKHSLRSAEISIDVAKPSLQQDLYDQLFHEFITVVNLYRNFRC